VDVPVIITTAYSDYAIKAFKVNSIDYLLKPLDESEFIEAFNKSLKMRQGAQPDYNKIQELISRNMPVEYRERFIVKLNEQIKVISIDEIAYFMAEEKVTFMVLNNGKRYITDYTLDSLETMLNPKKFFRLTRSYMVSINSVKTVYKYFNSRLKIKLEPVTQDEVLVSRIRVQDFLKWLEGI
jgi:DNA-binding LytR/AlgR family response regulator